MNIKEFASQPLTPLPRISPSRYLSLQQCPLKEIWASSRQSLLPHNPAAYLGTAIHNMLELAIQGKISNMDELSKAWNNEIERLEMMMFKNPVEKHLVPLRMSVFNFEVRKLLAFKMICSLFSDTSCRKSGNLKSSTEHWVQTPDGKVVGKIDLVNKADSGIEIVDYKTGPLTDEASPDHAKEEYLMQVKMYAALYNVMHGEWPLTIKLVGINQEIIALDVEPEECAKLLGDAEKSLNEINELLEAGLQSEDFAQPSLKACKYCLFRPACSRYWESRQEDGNWPADARGMIKNKSVLVNGRFRVVIATDEGEIAIRGLSPERHHFLKDEIKGAVFCNLWNEKLEGFFVENMFTTGYVLE